MAHQPTEATTIRMKAIRQAHTKPELLVREMLRDLGLHYRTCVRGLPGTPDIANQRAGWAIFVHGCYWHGHEGCKLFTVAKTNTEFWRTKIETNRARDARKEKALSDSGMNVVTVWQCETRHPVDLRRRLARELGVNDDR